MREFRLSHSSGQEVRALDHGQRLVAGLPDHGRRSPLLLGGTSTVDVAAVAAWALADGHAIVLEPDGVSSPVPGTRLTLCGGAPGCTPGDRGEPTGWHVAMFTSGSTGPARGYGFTLDQLDQLAAWYRTIYGASRASAFITHLPVTYNFTFVAGLYLAAKLGARLHLAASPADVFTEAAQLVPGHDRCVILANPVVLSRPPATRLAESVLIDSGGAPLSTWAITHYRFNVADLREGYGLTETGSLTHFDTEARLASLGTVGQAMPGVRARIIEIDGKPRVHVTTPALGVPIAGEPSATCEILTGDIGRIDRAGRLRLLGRSDDHSVNGRWPRDTLDLIGPILGTEPALVSHPTTGSVQVRLRRAPGDDVIQVMRTTIASHLDIHDDAVSVDHSNTSLLHSHKIPRQAPAPTKETR